MADPPSSEELKNAILVAGLKSSLRWSRILWQCRPLKPTTGAIAIYCHLGSTANAARLDRCSPNPHPQKGTCATATTGEGLHYFDVAGKVVATTLQERLQVLAQHKNSHSHNVAFERREAAVT